MTFAEAYKTVYCIDTSKYNTARDYCICIVYYAMLFKRNNVIIPDNIEPTEMTINLLSSYHHL